MYMYMYLYTCAYFKLISNSSTPHPRTGLYERYTRRSLTRTLQASIVYHIYASDSHNSAWIPIYTPNLKWMMMEFYVTKEVFLVFCVLFGECQSFVSHDLLSEPSRLKYAIPFQVPVFSLRICLCLLNCQHSHGLYFDTQSPCRPYF